MSDRCAAANCHNTRHQTGLSLFSFPRDEERMFKWFSESRRTDLNWETDKSKIRRLTMCEEHFAADQFMCPDDKGNPSKPRKRLRHDAIPQRCCSPATETSASDSIVPYFDNPDPDIQVIDIPDTDDDDDDDSTEATVIEATDPDVTVPDVSVVHNVANPCDQRSIIGDRCHVRKVSTPHVQTTPREQSLKRKLVQARTETCRLRKRLRSANELLLKAKQSVTLNEIVNAMSNYLSGHSLEFCITQLKLSGLQKKQQRFSYSMKLFCLSLHYKSPNAYRFLRRSFCLPSVRTLQKLFSHLDISC